MPIYFKLQYVIIFCNIHILHSITPVNQTGGSGKIIALPPGVRDNKNGSEGTLFD